MIELPEEVVGRPEFRRAVSAGDWSTVLQVAIQETGASQTEIAVAAGISQPHVSRLLNGQSREPGIRTVRALCECLGIPKALAGLLDQTMEDETKRRQFLAGAVGASGLALVGTIDGDVPLDPSDQERLLTIPSATYRRLEQRLPSRALIPSVGAHLALLGHLSRREQHSPAHTRRLYAISSETAGLAAWLYMDVEDRANARRHYQVAVRAAERSGHPLLPSYMQGSMGQFAADCGDGAQSVRLVSDARRRLPRSAPAMASVWLDSIESLALAAAGEKSALGKLDQAERRLGVAVGDEPVWPWIFRFDQRKLAGFRAKVASGLGYRQLAEESIRLAEDPNQPPKPQAMTTVLRAQLLAAGGHTDEACRVAVGAFDVGRRYGSERVLRAVGSFRKVLGAGIGRVADELDDRLYGTYRKDS